MLVKDMSLNDFEELCKARQDWGTKKYGDADKFRDTAKDLVEELSDVVNISQRRFNWILKDNNINECYARLMCSEIKKIQQDARFLFERVKILDRLIEKSEYIENDTVERIWFK